MAFGRFGVFFRTALSLEDLHKMSDSSGRRKFETYIFKDLGSGLTFRRLGSLHAIADRDQLSVDVFKTGPESISNDTLDLTFDEARCERLEGVIQEVVL